WHHSFSIAGVGFHRMPSSPSLSPATRNLLHSIANNRGGRAKRGHARLTTRYARSHTQKVFACPLLRSRINLMAPSTARRRDGGRLARLCRDGGGGRDTRPPNGDPFLPDPHIV